MSRHRCIGTIGCIDDMLAALGRLPTLTLVESGLTCWSRSQIWSDADNSQLLRKVRQSKAFPACSASGLHNCTRAVQQTTPLSQACGITFAHPSAGSVTCYGRHVNAAAVSVPGTLCRLWYTPFASSLRILCGSFESEVGKMFHSIPKLSLLSPVTCIPADRLFSWLQKRFMIAP
jgi:hypothetical protein